MNLPKWLPWSRDHPKNRLGGGFSFLFGGSLSGKVVNEQTAMQSTTVHSCVRVLAEAIAGLPLHVYEYTDDGGKERAIDHPLYQILHEAVNDEMTSFTFRETLMTHLLLWGNAYAQVIRNGRGQVLALYPLMPNKMEVKRAKSGELQYSYWRDADERGAKDAASVIVLHRQDILHIPGMGFDGVIGYSPIAMARNAIGLSLATEDYGSRYFANSANPGGILEHPSTVSDKDALKKEWHSQFSGEGSHHIAVLEEGMKFHPISINPTDSQFLETRKFQVSEIARIFRVPPHMIADLEKSSFSNIEQQSLEFVKYTLQPWLARWEMGIQQSLLTPIERRSMFVRFNVEGMLRGDYKSRMDGYAVARQNGWMSANDIRELENMNRIPKELGGDEYLVNGNLCKLSSAGAAYVVKDNM